MPTPKLQFPRESRPTSSPADVTIYPIRNKGTRTGTPVRFRWRNNHNGRVKSFATIEACAADVNRRFASDTKVTVSQVLR